MLIHYLPRIFTPDQLLPVKAQGGHEESSQAADDLNLSNYSQIESYMRKLMHPKTFQRTFPAFALSIRVPIWQSNMP